MFDGCVSISAVQWLCHATKSGHDPQRRVRKFFTALRAVLRGGARAVLQVYPEEPAHMTMLRDAALAVGFTGGLICDYPWSERSKKLFLVLIAPKRIAIAPQPGVGSSSDAAGAKRQHAGKRQRDGKRKGGKAHGGEPSGASVAAMPAGRGNDRLAGGIRKKNMKNKPRKGGGKKGHLVVSKAKGARVSDDC